MELLDYFTAQMEPLGVASREEVHQKGYWHKTFHCWVIRRETSQNYILFQKRSPSKSHFPGLLDITAAGHFMAGETVETAARELQEELGISFTFEELIPMGIRKDEVQIGEQMNREFCHTYFLINTLPLNAYSVQVEEVAGLLALNIAEVRSLIQGSRSELHTLMYSWAIEGTVDHQEVLLSKKDFLPHPDAYYLEIFSLAEEILDAL